MRESGLLAAHFISSPGFLVAPSLPRRRCHLHGRMNLTAVLAASPFFVVVQGGKKRKLGEGNAEAAKAAAAAAADAAAAAAAAAVAAQAAAAVAEPNGPSGDKKAKDGEDSSSGSTDTNNKSGGGGGGGDGNGGGGSRTFEDIVLTPPSPDDLIATYVLVRVSSCYLGRPSRLLAVATALVPSLPQLFPRPYTICLQHVCILLPDRTQNGGCFSRVRAHARTHARTCLLRVLLRLFLFLSAITVHRRKARRASSKPSGSCRKS